MEHAQRERGFFVPQTLFCLNPYFNGTCSKSAFHKLLVANDLLVLILILMEHAQRVHVIEKTEPFCPSLNPYFNGTCSKSLLLEFMCLMVFMS